MKRLLFWGLSIFPMLLSAQQLEQTIKGKIIDAQSGSPVIGATIAVLTTDPLKGAATDMEGYFKITNVPVGRHTLRLSSIGYDDKIVPELLVGSGKEVVLDATLTESFTIMDEVVVSAAEQNKGLVLNEMASVSAISFSVEETSRYAATFDDPARAALSLPGVQGGGDDVLNEIVIRGNSPRGLLWRIEGVEVFNPNHFAEVGSSAGGISMLSNNMMNRSDFYTGAFPAEYGNALSGVFDINLRQGNYDKGEYAFQAGLLGVAASAEGPFKQGSKSSYLLNYRYSTLALFDDVGVEILGEQEDLVFQDLSFKMHFPTRNAGSFSVWGLGGANHDIYYADQEVGEFVNDDFRTKMGVYGINHVMYFNPDTYLKTTLSQSVSTNKYISDSLGTKEYNRESFDNNATRLQFLFNKKMNSRNTFRAGVIGSRLGYNLFSEFNFRDEFITEVDDDGTTYFVQGYGQWQHRLSEAVVINAGLHYSQLLLNNNYSIEPRIGLKWEVDPTSSINFGLGIHSRLESITNYLTQDSLGRQNNKDLDLTKAQHVVLGYEKMVKPGVRFKAEAYYQHLYDVPVWPSTAETDFQRTFSAINSKDGFTSFDLVNDGTGDNYGIELSLERFMSNGLYYLLTTSLYQSEYTPQDGNTYDTRFNGNFIFNALAGKEWRVGRKKTNFISVNGRMIWSGGNRTHPIDLEKSRELGYTFYDFSQPYGYKLPNYWRMDLGVSYRKNKGNHSSIIAINVQNVTGKLNYYDHYYSSSQDAVMLEEQLGMFPNLSYRVEF